MTASRIPDQARSYALLIGVSEYDRSSGYGGVPTAGASVRELERLIKSPQMWHLPDRGHVKTLTGQVTLRQAAAEIQKAANRPSMDGLLIYICAHGRVFGEDWVPDKNLHFAFSDSEHAWAYTHLPFLAVRRMLKRRPNAAGTLLIIDSCYAGNAFLGSAGVPGGWGNQPLDDVEYCTLVATKGNQQIPSKVPGSDFTPFAGAIIDVIRDGVDGPAEFLTASAVKEEVRTKLLAAGLPEPDMRATGTSLLVCRNQRCHSVALSQSVEQLLALLDHPDSVSIAVYAAAIAEEHQARPQTAGQIAAAFGEKRAGAESFELAMALRTSGTAGLGECADVLVERVFACRPAADIVTLLHRHDGPAVGVDSVLQALLERPDREAAEVSAGLREMRCPACALIKQQFDGRMYDIWPEDRRLGLLSAVY